MNHWSCISWCWWSQQKRRIVHPCAGGQATVSLLLNSLCGKTEVSPNYTNLIQDTAVQSQCWRLKPELRASETWMCLMFGLILKYWSIDLMSAMNLKLWTVKAYWWLEIHICTSFCLKKCQGSHVLKKACATTNSFTLLALVHFKNWQIGLKNYTGNDNLKR